MVPAIGEYSAQCKYGDQTHTLNFKVIHGDQRPLLSGATCKTLGVTKIETVHHTTQMPDLIEQYADVFQGLRCLDGDYHIELDPSVSPVQHVPRRVPIALKQQLKEKLDSLAAQGIIQSVPSSTLWISSLVVITKLGKLRVCIDPRDLNKTILRPKYQIHILDEILPTLSIARIFSLLDAKEGFHQGKLDEESFYLTAFWTPFGRY